MPGGLTNVLRGEIIMSEVTRKALVEVRNAFSGLFDETTGEWSKGTGEKVALIAFLLCILAVSLIGNM